MNVLQHLLAMPQRDDYTVVDHKGKKHTVRALSPDEALRMIARQEHLHERHLKVKKGN